MQFTRQKSAKREIIVSDRNSYFPDTKQSWGYWQFKPVLFLTLLLLNLFTDKVLSQSTPSNIQADDTLGSESSQIIQNFQGQPIEVITGGAIRAINLFHSFKEFNVGKQRGVYFFNSNGRIQNILTRVTGGNRSEILGTLGTFGNSKPNLFLINPNGIIFGENARLNVQGSFIATTANDVQFGNQGFFSATNPEAPSSLLTINPGALFFNRINQTVSIQNNSGLLRVPDGTSLLLVGGNVRMDGGVAIANGGRVELGGLASAGTVILNEDGKNISLSFPENVERSNVFLSKGASVSVLSGGGAIVQEPPLSAIAINSKNLELREGSALSASITGSLGSQDTKAGDIVINATESIVLDGGRIDSTLLTPDTQGRGGNIEISTGNLTIGNNGNISVSSSGKGNAGNVKIEAKNEVVSDSGQIESVLLPNAQGKGGNISINAKKISLLNDAFVEASSLTKGDAGNIQINANEKIILDRSSINSSVLFAQEFNFLGEGNAGKIEIKSPQIFLNNNSLIANSNTRQGNAGNISLEARDLFSAANGSIIESSLGQPNGTSAEGKVGTISIFAKNVSFTNGSALLARSYSNSIGEAGTLSIQATDSISFDGFNSSIVTAVAPGARANGSNIKLEANAISIANGARLSTSIFGKGNGGNMRITAKDTVFVDNSSIDSGVGKTGEGNAGEIDIKTSKIFFNNGAQLSTESQGQGNAGNIMISANSFTLDRNSSILALNTPSVASSTSLSGGNITLRIADRLLLSNNSDISTQASSNANGGNIDITASAIIAFDDSDLFAFAQQGKGGNITLNTPAYFGFNFNPASSQIKPNPSNNFLNGNNRADINATGELSSGNTFIPDTSYIQNNLAELVQTPIDTNALIANSCIARRGKQENTFTVTGSGGLPNRPGDIAVSVYSTGDVRNVQTENRSRPWQKGDPILEPQNVYYLPSGKLVLSRECPQ